MHRLTQHRDILGRVGANENGLSLLLVAEEVFSHFGNALLVKTVERLVEDEYLRVFHDSLRKSEALSHTERILSFVSAQVGIEAHHSHTFTDFFLADKAFVALGAEGDHQDEAPKKQVLYRLSLINYRIIRHLRAYLF